MSMMTSNENIIESVEDIAPVTGKNTRIIIAGGGTGGHIFPALAIAAALKKTEPEIEILFVGAKGKMEMEKIPEAGYKIIGLTIAGYNRSSLIRNITFAIKTGAKLFPGNGNIKDIQTGCSGRSWRIFKFSGFKAGANPQHTNFYS